MISRDRGMGKEGSNAKVVTNVSVIPCNVVWVEIKEVIDKNEEALN